MFKENYRAYDKEEFLVDSGDVEFYKIKKLLEKNPKSLKEDPLLGIDYLKIIGLIKRKKLLEATSDEFNPADSIDSTYYDLDLIDREKLFKAKKEEEKYMREQEIQDSEAASDRLSLQDEESESSLRSAKKREERDKQKLIKQFDTLAQ